MSRDAHAGDSREEFKGTTGRGEWADSLTEHDSDLGTVLDLLDELG
jgi:arylsulfatase